MKKQAGFTVVELLVVLVLLMVGTWLFFSERSNVQSAVRDQERKIAINAMYYNLEEVYYEKNGFYPASIDSKTLRAMDPELFTDPTGYKISESGSNYTYEGIDCNASNQCKKYRLSSSMELEAEYVKTNRN